MDKVIQETSKFKLEYRDNEILFLIKTVQPYKAFQLPLADCAELMETLAKLTGDIEAEFARIEKAQFKPVVLTPVKPQNHT